MSHMHHFWLFAPIFLGSQASIHRESEKAHSRKLVVASPAINIPFYSAQSSVTP